MIGAIAGDVIGSVHERAGTKTTDFLLFSEFACFTDDTALTAAVAEGLLTGTDYVDLFHAYYRRYPTAGYGGTFVKWAQAGERRPYCSWGNGSAMRVSPVAYAFDTLDAVLLEAERSAAVTHDHPEGIRGARAVAGAVFLARTGGTKEDVRRFVVDDVGYRLDRPLADIRPTYAFDVSCQGSVPEAIQAFLEADGYESAVRNAVSLGGDADTQACIAGAIAEAYFGVPAPIREWTIGRLNDHLRGVLVQFEERFVLNARRRH